MTRAELLITARLLDIAADEFAKHGSNDLTEEVKRMITPNEWDRITREYHNWNGDPEEFRPGKIINNDSAIMAFMAHKLKKEAK